VAKSEGKRPLGRPRRRREDGIRMDLRENGWRSVEWVQLAQNRDRQRVLVRYEPACSGATELVSIASLFRVEIIVIELSVVMPPNNVYLTFDMIYHANICVILVQIHFGSWTDWNLFQ
jgi:hypothetical protein